MRPTRHARLLVGVFFCTALLAGCAHQAPLTGERLAGLPPRVELTGTPFFPQARYQCGPAALATVLNVRGAAVTPEALVPQVYLPAREGSLQAEMVAAARRQGLLALPVEPELDALLAEIAAGHPVLVLQNLGLKWMPRWHYAVAIGYDLARQELILRSGVEPRRVTPFRVFLNTWDRSARWGIVVLTPGTFAARVQATSYLEAASALESLGRHQEAHAAYQASTERWPDNSVAWLGLGNTDYALGHDRQAEQAFRRAIDVEVATAVAWNNLAYALARQQCIRSAREAAQCAQDLAPGDSAFAHTVKEMKELPMAAGGVQTCQPLPACPFGTRPETSGQWEKGLAVPETESRAACGEEPVSGPLCRS
jgi:tetratricopeptide (TPR) repeat protein